MITICHKIIFETGPGFTQLEVAQFVCLGVLKPEVILGCLLRKPLVQIIVLGPAYVDLASKQN